jgi:peptidoglycan/xylan/chitin deacetylase (PgdA/CDA1 family)
MIPVLMYHRIGTPARENRFKGQYTPEKMFARQMKYLFDHGYQTISLRDLISYAMLPAPAGDKKICITFDDGYESVYTYGFSVLQKYNFTAVVFLVADCINKTCLWDEDPEPILTTEQIKEMAEAGIDFGSHSFSHRSLVELDTEELEKEVKGSKTALEELLGKQIESFSYPYGAFNETVKNMVQQSYKVAFSTKKGIGDIQGFALRRIDINKDKILPVFIYLLWEARHRR